MHTPRVLREIVGDGIRLGGTGAAAGIVGALLVAPHLELAMNHRRSKDLWPWVSGPLGRLVVVVIASGLPARRALSVDPLTVMRED